MATSIPPTLEQAPHQQVLRQGPYWLIVSAALLSPSAYFGLLLLIGVLELPAPPPALIVGLFVLIPVAALGYCALVIWNSNLTVGWKIGGIVFVVSALLVQMALIMSVIYALLVALTSYA